MATTYLRLFPAVNQFELENGQLNVAGHIRVYYQGTDDLADIFDEDGTQLAQPAILDSNGRTLGLFVDASRTYRLEVYDRFDSLIYTVQKMTPCGGGGGSALGNIYQIVSSDGTLNIDEYDDGGVKTFDLSTHVEDSTDLLEWVAATGSSVLEGGVYRANYAGGTMEIGDRGVIMAGGRYYHVTLHMVANKNVSDPSYDDITVHLQGRDRNTGDIVEYTSVDKVIDYSMGLAQEFEVSADILPATDIELLVVIDGSEITGATFGIVDMDVHRVYSGAPYIPGGVAPKPWVAEHYQETLTAGTGITIDENNVISATAAEQVNADWDANSGVAEILNKPDLSVYAEKSELEDYQEKLTAGTGISIDADNVISATADAQVNADWDANSGVAEILNKPDLSVYAEKTELSDYQEKLTAGTGILIDADNVISATADAQVNADWDATSGVQEILHKPDLSIYAQSANLAAVATSGSYNDLFDKPTIPAAQVNSDWDSTSGKSQILNKPDLSVYAEKTELSDYQEKLMAGTGITIDADNVISASATAQVNSDWDATSGVAEILNKPTEKDLVAGVNISITESGNSVIISAAGGGSSVNADWNAASGQPGYIENKPTLAAVATSGSYNDLSNKPTIPAAQVNSDWDSNSGVSKILNKPDLSIYAESANLATVATSGSYTDLLDKPTIPAAQVNSDWNSSTGLSEILNKPDLSIYAESANLATVATSGSYNDLSNTPTIPAAQVNSDWDATSGVSEILNKPAETTLVAGTGVVITEPTSNTLRISADETVLWENASGKSPNTAGDFPITLSEAITHFDTVRIYWQAFNDSAKNHLVSEKMTDLGNITLEAGIYNTSSDKCFSIIWALGVSGTTVSHIAAKYNGWESTTVNNGVSFVRLYKIVGVKRVSS